MKALNMLHICKTLIQKFLIYCLVNQAILVIYVLQLILIIFFMTALSGLILYYLLDQITENDTYVLCVFRIFYIYQNYLPDAKENPRL